MRANYRDLLAELGDGRRATWGPAMRVIAELKLIDARGHSPTQDTVYRTWRRVRIEMAAARASEYATPLKKHEIAPGVRGLNEEIDRIRPSGRQLDIRPARTRAPPPPGNPPSAPAAKDAPSTMSGMNDRLEQVRQVFEKIGATRTPMPKPVV